MAYKVQPDFVCENCIKCGSRPVVEQNKHLWIVKCPNDECNNAVASSIVDFKAWDRKNKPSVPLKKGNDDPLKKSS